MADAVQVRADTRPGAGAVVLTTPGGEVRLSWLEAGRLADAVQDARRAVAVADLRRRGRQARKGEG